MAVSDEAVRILIVDDEEGMREGMRRVLERRGYAVRTARDGETALRLLEEEPADVALVDLKMPGIDGFKVTECITRRFAGRTVVVIVSALATVEAAVEVTQHGAFDFLVKPFTPDDLLQVANRAAQQWRLIREREKYLSELAGERSLSHQMICSMHEGVVVFNIRREPVLMNPRAERFLGKRFREGATLSDLFPSLDAAAAIEAVIDSASARPQSRAMQLAVGEVRVQLSISPLLRDGEAGGAIVILSDATGGWEAAQDRNRFVSLVTDGLKGPLSAIVNDLTLVLGGMFDNDAPMRREVLGRCRARGASLLDLLRDLARVISPEAGGAERSIEELDLREVIASQLELFRRKAEERKIVMTMIAPLPAYSVKADRGDLDRIFMNLISNGIKFNREKGSLTVRITEAGSAWEVVVSDTGIGMSDAELAGLFQEFYRVKSSQTSDIAGTGLGLATVKRVLGTYNGTISVQSKPDAGSTFTVRFPKE